MNAIQDKCRPKHQVLILRCYPRTTKGAVDVKPNSSELSYLLFYATSRRSKIQKIGAFLERKTASDIWRMRIGNVQVTLGILAALVEKSPKDAVLISAVVLKILDLVLKSDDITMIESSLPTWEAFCDNHDPSSLFADQAYLEHYQAVVRAYAQLASTRPLLNRGEDSRRPMLNRRRTAGISAIKSVASSDALASVTGRQIDVIVPKMLENLWTDDDEALDILLQRLRRDEKEDHPVPITRRRTSISTVRTNETVDGANPIAFSGTANDADKLAEEEIAVEALACLRSIFIIPNRPQVYAATNALVRFIFERVSESQSVIDTKPDSGWGPKMFRIVARWAPVQDRYVILVMALDSLIRSPMTESNLIQHLALTTIIGSLLRSDINLIGLSVIDVLLGLIKQMRRLFALQLGDGSRETGEEKTSSDVEMSRKKDLLLQLETCIADLATHVYYADQISDMISAILARLKPTRSSSITSTAPIEKLAVTQDGPDSPVTDVAEQTQTENYFSYNAGRVSALRAIKQILMVANPKTKLSGHMDLSRERVPAHIWEGSQWLLRDPDGAVRKAYAEAIVTWLDRETTRADARAHDELAVKARKVDERYSNKTTHRVISNASNREPSGRSRRSQFLPTLHLTIYDNALQFVDSESDIVLLYILLAKMLFRLGVNAARYGVPMIYRLQEDIQDIEAPLHKVRIAALCHGYFWALTEKFEFEGSSVGRAIHNEVVRRRSKGFWVEGINVPVPSTSQVGVPGQTGKSPAWDSELLEREEILPFDERTTLVQSIATAYEEMGRSPPQSPLHSPKRESYNPMLSVHSTSMAAEVGEAGDIELPGHFREQMLTNFSREAVLAALDAEGKADSPNGSRTGTTITTRHQVAINFGGHFAQGHLASPFGSQRAMRPKSSFQNEAGQDKLALFAVAGRKSSVRSALSPVSNGPPKMSIPSVEQLKLILSGHGSASALRQTDDDSGDSMVSYESPSESSFNPPRRIDTAGTSSGTMSSPIKESLDSLNTSQQSGEGESEVPPVPPIPKTHSFQKMDPLSEIAVQDYASTGYPRKRNLPNRASAREDSSRGIDLQEMLRGIDSRSGEGSLGNLTKPPY